MSPTQPPRPPPCHHEWHVSVDPTASNFEALALRRECRTCGRIEHADLEDYREKDDEPGSIFDRR
jgi:hypothetical protein